jgi:hypothetical protein
MFDEDSRAVQSPFGWWRGGRKKKDNKTIKKTKNISTGSTRFDGKRRRMRLYTPPVFLFCFALYDVKV